MNGSEKPFYKNRIKKIKKTVKIKVNAACEQQTTSEKANSCSNAI